MFIRDNLVTKRMEVNRNLAQRKVLSLTFSSIGRFLVDHVTSRDHISENSKLLRNGNGLKRKKKRFSGGDNISSSSRLKLTSIVL